NDRQDAIGRLFSDGGLTEVAGVSAFLFAHVLLGLTLSVAKDLSDVHVGAVLLVGAWYALSKPRLERAAYLAAYITGAGTLWRMRSASVFWEVGKYSITVFFVLSLLRTGRLKGPVMPFLYLLLLLPSLVLPMINVSGSELQNEISFNISGPLALAASAWFF